jgi:hypothetical protein
MNPKASQVYVLRVWWEPGQEGPVWRAALSRGGKEEKRLFASLEALLAFLSEEWGGLEGAGSLSPGDEVE